LSAVSPSRPANLWLIFAAAFAKLASDIFSVEIICLDFYNRWALLNTFEALLMPCVSVTCIESFGLTGAATGGILIKLAFILVSYNPLMRFRSPLDNTSKIAFPGSVGHL
jgi:hypothetical protein